MGKKGLAIWLFSTLTLISFLHLIDAINAIVFNNRIRLLQLYPFINEQLEQIPIDAYFYVSVASTVILWGITCVIAFDNPVEAFLNKIMSDAKKQSATETQLLESKSELLELTYETVESDRETLAQVKDLMCNVRSDVRDIQPMKEIMEKTQIEIGNLKKQIKIFDEKLHFTILCSACGKPLMPEFKICPYCGENVKLEEKMIMVKNYK